MDEKYDAYIDYWINDEYKKEIMAKDITIPKQKCDICDWIYQQSISKEEADEFCKNCISKHLMDLFTKDLDETTT